MTLEVAVPPILPLLLFLFNRGITLFIDLLPQPSLKRKGTGQSSVIYFFNAF